MKPFAAVQALLNYNKTSKRTDIVGSCFRLWSPIHFITANHCIENTNPSELKVMNPFSNYQNLNCVEIYRHAEADIAVLKVTGSVPEQFEKFKISGDEPSYGAPIHCFGIIPNLIKTGAPGRVIGGIVQRDLIHKDHKYKSHSIELSVPIPKGMSGGPAFLAHRDDSAIGVAIGTIKSEVVISEFINYQDEKTQEKERISEITRYGIILTLYSVRNWLEEIIPKQD